MNDMDYNEFLERVINEGIAAANADYTDETDKHRLEGSVAGFNACRNQHPEGLAGIYYEACQYMNEAFWDRDNPDKYWWFRCYQAEVEWVCNVVSAMLFNIDQPPILSHLPTCNGMMKAASIIGVATP